MAATQYYVASSIDGYIATADGNLDWLLQFSGFEGFAESYDPFLAGVGAVIMGADTYRFLLAAQEPWPYPTLPAWVFSHQDLPPFDDGIISYVRGGVEAVHAAALEAAAGRNVWMVGGGNLAAQFFAAGLLDELLLTIVPVLLGSGKPLLPLAGPTFPLALRSERRLGSGVVELAYALR
jgi:dihydrofolate reductase